MKNANSLNFAAVPAGKYVVAVSGGVDSVVLLDMVAGQDGLELVVAHVDHGIRLESGDDLEFVEELAGHYGLPFYFARVRLGQGASEAQAREVRYGFLFSLKARLGSDGVITAHHQDDLIETSLLHVLRGTGRRGLGGFSDPHVLRPLLGVTKQSLKEYAAKQNLQWHEDPTNQDPAYRRNFVRHQLIPQAQVQDGLFKERWLDHVRQANELNTAIDTELAGLLQKHVHRSNQSWKFSRTWFVTLPHAVAREVLWALLKQARARDVSRLRLEQLTIHLKTGKINTRYDVDYQWEFRISRTSSHQTHIGLAIK